MAKVRTVVSRFVGGIQCLLGALASAFAFLVYLSPSIRDALAVTSEEVYLYMFLFSVFGVFSLLSGLLLVPEEK